MNTAVQNVPFDDENSYVPKATPVAPNAEPKADIKGARKADGAFRTISEVADELDVPQHVLRFWETKFSQVKPLKRGGGRRYYRPEDVALLKHIHHQLYTEGYTIKGVQKLLKGQGKNQIAAKVEADAAAETQSMMPPKAPANVAAPVAQQPQPAPQQQVHQVQGNIFQQTVSAKVYKLSDGQRGALENMLSELKQLRAMFPEQV
ncbi:MAG: MerR family transcriptional regulator [Micavibrio aeruginosavorus]|uniref:MerR family transcriptional regulator n=1 Tax=Micavibrio aeruginosavorus TaxID=349221 RepID=A0A2W5A123_9BACT|nr:MAG: MerR family transcriptional regulator [Micavibrio aeruginosavorus]